MLTSVFACVVTALCRLFFFLSLLLFFFFSSLLVLDRREVHGRTHALRRRRRQTLDFLRRQTRVEELRAGDAAVKDVVAHVHEVARLKHAHTLVEVAVERLHEPAVRL